MSVEVQHLWTYILYSFLLWVQFILTHFTFPLTPIEWTLSDFLPSSSVLLHEAEVCLWSLTYSYMRLSYKLAFSNRLWAQSSEDLPLWDQTFVRSSTDFLILAIHQVWAYQGISKVTSCTAVDCTKCQTQTTFFLVEAAPHTGSLGLSFYTAWTAQDSDHSTPP